MQADELEYLGNEGDLDLHGLSGMEAMRVFIEAYNAHLRSAGATPFKVIHGWGSSGEGGNVISAKISALLDKHPDKASYARQGGCTTIHPISPLPTYAQCLEERILAYCASPRSQSKIDSEFHAWGSSDVLDAIRRLKKNKMIREDWKGKHKRFVTAT